MTRLGELGSLPEDERRRLGFADTLREVLQQPETWRETEKLVEEAAIEAPYGHGGPVLLTGSGSSHFIGESLEPVLARKLGRPVRAMPAGSLLTDLDAVVPESTEGTLVSFARSGESPESVGVSDLFLASRPKFRHLVLTCNREGALATRYRERDEVRSVVLAPRTCDRSLVMTSSFTNLWLAGRLLAARTDVARLAENARTVLERFSDRLAELAELGSPSAIFLGTGSRFGAARECALKLLEMSDGRVPTFAETFLGFRHGPMCAARQGALLVALLSSEEPARGYELDLLHEVERKGLGVTRLTVGPEGDVPTEVPDDDKAVVGVVVGQLIAFFTSLGLGLRPDAPSPDEAISRVVTPFRIR